MPTDQLRQALAMFDEGEPGAGDDPYVELERVLNAARFALKVWEGDEQLVAQMAHAIRHAPLDSTLMVRAVLAAITEESGE